MGLAGVFWRFSVLVAVIAAIVLLPALKEHRERLYRLLSTCPMHWFQNAPAESGSDSSVIKTGSHPLFTKEELANYDGTEGSKGLYIGIYGRIYDVSKGSQHYGPGGGYNFFAGRDGTKAFVTGAFNDEGLIDDVTGLDSRRMLEMLNWIEFYEKTYTFVGKVIGNFYDASGRPTEVLLEAEVATKKALDEKRLQDEERLVFPPCNSHWSEATGSRVWCSTKSGGVERDWSGVPRMLFDPKSTSQRCVCVRDTGPPSMTSLPDTGQGDLEYPNLRPYVGCEPTSDSCVIQ